MGMRVLGISEVNSWDSVTIICNRDLRCVNPSVSPKQRHQQPTLTSGHDSIAKVSDVTLLLFRERSLQKYLKIVSLLCLFSPQGECGQGAVLAFAGTLDKRGINTSESDVALVSPRCCFATSPPYNLSILDDHLLPPSLIKPSECTICRLYLPHTASSFTSLIPWVLHPPPLYHHLLPASPLPL
jgi:hypothetical protein